MNNGVTTFVGRGKPRKPAALRAKSKKAERDAALAEAKPVPPPPAGLTEHERAAWTDLKAIVDPLGVFTPADRVAFEQLVLNLAMILEARDALRENGLTVEGDRGPKQRPEVQVILTAQKNLWYGLSRFGLSPSDRSRVDGGVTPPGESEFERARRLKLERFGGRGG